MPNHPGGQMGGPGQGPPRMMRPGQQFPPHFPPRGMPQGATQRLTHMAAAATGQGPQQVPPGQPGMPPRYPGAAVSAAQRRHILLQDQALLIEELLEKVRKILTLL